MFDIDLIPIEITPLEIPSSTFHNNITISTFLFCTLPFFSLGRHKFNEKIVKESSLFFFEPKNSLKIIVKALHSRTICLCTMGEIIFYYLCFIAKIIHLRTIRTNYLLVTKLFNLFFNRKKSLFGINISKIIRSTPAPEKN